MIQFAKPKLQIEFALALLRFRAIYLQTALLATVREMNISEIDQELKSFVKPADLAALAQFGMRGELLFALPCVLKANPYLLGYYRLLLGYSQKEFYGRDKGFGVGGFKKMELKGIISTNAALSLPDLCKAFCQAASELLDGISSLLVSKELFDDLSLLTVGAQMRGTVNNQLGASGIVKVFEIIREIVAHAAVDVKQTAITVQSATRRPIRIEFAADPDIVIREEMAPHQFRFVLAIEIKSGTDASNIHNRIGEAEKSHQKARQKGYTECWTVVNVSRLDFQVAKNESPSTDRFYLLSELASRTGSVYEDFRMRLLALTSIPQPPLAPPPK